VSDALQEAIVEAAWSVQQNLCGAMIRAEDDSEVHLFGPDEDNDGYRPYYSFCFDLLREHAPIGDLKPFLDAALPPPAISHGGREYHLPALVIVFEEGTPVLDEQRTTALQQTYAEQIAKLLAG
jgi:hypothetical protein